MDHRTHKRGEHQQMSTVADLNMARDYVLAIGGPGKGQSIVAKAYRVLTDLFPHADEPRDQWTQRRLRAFLDREAALVKYREMVELHRAAEQEKSERRLLEQARKDHAAYIAKTASMRAFLEHQDEAFHGPELERLRGVARGVDSPRVEG